MAILNCFPLYDSELDALYSNDSIFPAYIYFDNQTTSGGDGGLSTVIMYDSSTTQLKRLEFYRVTESGGSRDHAVKVYPLITFYLIPAFRGVKRTEDAIKVEPGREYKVVVVLNSALSISYYRIYKDDVLIYEYPTNSLPPGTPMSDDGTLFYWSYTNE